MQKRKGQRELRQPFQNSFKTMWFENILSKEVFKTEEKNHNNIFECDNSAIHLQLRYRRHAKYGAGLFYGKKMELETVFCAQVALSRWRAIVQVAKETSWQGLVHLHSLICPPSLT